MNEMKTTKQANEAARRAAEEYGLNEDKFANFWNDRFGTYSPGYARQWADRIASNRAHVLADNKTKAALNRAGFRGDQ